MRNEMIKATYIDHTGEEVMTKLEELKAAWDAARAAADDAWDDAWAAWDAARAAADDDRAAAWAAADAYHDELKKTEKENR